MAVESGHGGETMPKEPYLTPEIQSEEVAPGVLAADGSPVINGEVPGPLSNFTGELGTCCGGCGCG